MQSKYQYFVVITLGVILFLVGGLVWGFAFQPSTVEASSSQQDAPSNTITVIGEGTGSGAPDLAKVSIGVQVSDTDVQAATQKAADDMEAVLAALNAQGVAPADIKTSYYNLYVERPFNPEGTTTEPIYQVSNTLEVTIRELDNVTTILGAAIEAGANNINSVTFDISEQAPLHSEARQKAIEDARATAEELAQLNGVTLGDVVSVSEVIQAYPIFEAASVGIGGGVAGPITPGNVNITAQLEVTYAIVR
jgi:uncharacterized protein YggE